MPATIREIIKERAKERNTSLTKLAREVGVSYAHLRNVLRGVYVSRPVIRKLAQILDMPELPELYEKALKEGRF